MLLLIPSAICLLLLVVHSYVYRGWRITLTFFGWCYVIRVLKCIGDAMPGHNDYWPLMDFLTIKGRPMGAFLFVVPIGWMFAHYISWCVAEAILRNKPKKRDALFPMAALSILGVGLIGICMEKVNEAMHWWQWASYLKPSSLLYFLVWTLWPLQFFYFFFIFYLKGPSKKALHIGAISWYIFTLIVWGFLWQMFRFWTTLFLGVLLFAHIFLYFANSVKLQPLRKDIAEEL